MLKLPPREDLHGCNIADFAAHAREGLEIRKLVRDGRARLEFELELRRTNGEVFWAMGHMIVTRDESGGVVFLDGIVQDIHSRKLLESALSRGKEEWENTFDAVQELLVLVDGDSSIVRFNSAFAARFDGIGPVVPGLSCLDLLADPEDEKRRTLLRRMIRSGSSHDVDLSSELLGGDFRFSVSPRRDLEGRLVGAVLVGRDVTLARKHEQLERLRSAISQAERIFRTLRHEVGNSLNTLKTTLSVFKMKIDDFDEQKRRTYFDRCFATLHIAEGLLRSLQSYQTFDRLDLRVLDLGEVLEQRLELAFENARAKKVSCRFDQCADELRVTADADALFRIILNLVDNAVAAVSGATSPLIRVRCSSRLGMALLEVEDNGCGIPEEELPLVFAPLHTTRPDGSGMGLAIVQKLMVNMGGLAEIRSRVGVGTTVTLRLPLVEEGGAVQPRRGQVRAAGGRGDGGPQ
jgi:signal transduction histidine kinase